MMEKTPSSVSMGRRRGEMMWMPEKARDCRGEGSGDWGSGSWVLGDCSGTWGRGEWVGGRGKLGSRGGPGGLVLLLEGGGGGVFGGWAGWGGGGWVFGVECERAAERQC